MKELYREKVWGGWRVFLSPKLLAYLRLKYCLRDLEGISGRVLDAGCGAGGFSKGVKFYRPDLQIIGVDSNKKAIASAKKDSFGVEFVQGDIYGLPFPKTFFDAVIVEDVLEHLKDPKKALKEINRVLKKKGLFHAFVPLEGEWYTLHFWLARLGLRSKKLLAGHIQDFTLGGLKELLQESGFSIESVRFSTHFFGQVVDVSFYFYLSFAKKKLKRGLEVELENKPLLKFIKNTLTLITNLESLALFFLPAAGVHIKCIKQN